jgi:hypothetical protein
VVYTPIYIKMSQRRSSAYGLSTVPAAFSPDRFPCDAAPIFVSSRLRASALEYQSYILLKGLNQMKGIGRYLSDSAHKSVFSAFRNHHVWIHIPRFDLDCQTLYTQNTVQTSLPDVSIFSCIRHFFSQTYFWNRYPVARHPINLCHCAGVTSALMYTA